MSSIVSDNISNCEELTDDLAASDRTLADDVGGRLVDAPPFVNGPDECDTLKAVSCVPRGDRFDGVMHQFTDLQLSNGRTVTNSCELDCNGRCVVNENAETLSPTGPVDRQLPAVAASPVKHQVPSVREANGLLKSKQLHVWNTTRIERSNLLSICKLVVKHLIETSLSQGSLVDEENVHLLQFLTVMESILCHGLKPKKGLLRDTERHDCWECLEQFGHLWPSVMISIRDMPYLRTNLGRMRAWLRLVVMQKTLADYFRAMIDCSSKLLLEYYEPQALLLSDEAAIVAGLLVGLNVVDCAITVKGDDLDQPMAMINYGLYMREILSPPSDEDSRHLHEVQQYSSKQVGVGKEIAAMIDQKNYLEEYNRSLTTTVARLGQQIESLKGANAATVDEISLMRSTLAHVQHENTMLRCENSALHEGHQRQLQMALQDIETERETYKQSRQGLDTLYQNVKQKLDNEMELRSVTEKKLEIQAVLKLEMDVAVQSLEKELRDKTDLLTSLQQQLDEVKEMNLNLQSNLQSLETSLQHKTDVINGLENKTSQMASALHSLENEKSKITAEKSELEDMLKKLGDQLTDVDNTRSSLEAELRVEKEWRATLQQSLDKEKMMAAKLLKECQHLKELKKEYEQLQIKFNELGQRNSEQDSALTELGSHLSQSQLKMQDMKEAHHAMKDAQWAEDKEATHCRQCRKMFSVSRRKHHCRNCGDIFCNECSSVKMPLPSSAKPVRVCDACSSSIQSRFSTQ